MDFLSTLSCPGGELVPERFRTYQTVSKYRQGESDGWQLVKREGAPVTLSTSTLTFYVSRFT